MTLAIDDLRFAVDDARKRHTAVADLINVIDRQALGLMQLYLTLASASISAAAAISLSSAHHAKLLVIVLIALALPLTCGAILCLISMWPARINLAGRDPDFWLWAMQPGVTTESVYQSYLENLAAKKDMNDRLNKTMARWLDRAKRAGAISPFCAGVGLFFAYAARL
jgi:hypothetical protein